jgi:hypothetical protein
LPAADIHAVLVAAAGDGDDATQARQPLYSSSVGSWRSAYRSQLEPLKLALGGTIRMYEQRLAAAAAAAAAACSSRTATCSNATFNTIVCGIAQNSSHEA